MAPLIRFTLIGLYLALVMPLPVLAPPALRLTMLGAVPIGLILVVAITSETVQLDSLGIRVGHPPWCGWLLRRGWSLAWNQVVGLTPVATSQGGRVFYVRGGDGSGAYLLPQRVDRFDDFLVRFSSCSGFKTTDVVRLTPAWTYRLLAVLTGMLMAGEVVAIGLITAGQLPLN